MTQQEYDPAKAARDHVQRRYDDVHLAIALHTSMARSGEAPTKRSTDVATKGYESLRELRRLADSAWPIEVHRQYLASLDERDALQAQLDERIAAELRPPSNPVKFRSEGGYPSLGWITAATVVALLVVLLVWLALS